MTCETLVYLNNNHYVFDIQLDYNPEQNNIQTEMCITFTVHLSGVLTDFQHVYGVSLLEPSEE